MRTHLIILLTAIVFAGCTVSGPAVSQPTSEPPLATPTTVPTKTPSPEPTLTHTPAPTPTPTWVAQGPGHVLVPILMYHHIAVSPVDSIFYVTPEAFDEQLRLLQNWGYTSISTSMLVEAITKGAALPPHPIILTFDDAHEDNYTNAFPIMRKYDFTGVLYVPYDYIGTSGSLSIAEIQEMAAAGWEIGSHTLSHPLNFLNLDPAAMRAEIVGSRKQLSSLLHLPILTFAYPFGDNNSAVTDYVIYAGYIAGMGATGFTADQGPSNLFVLQRCEIRGSETVKTMTRFLPWHGDPAFLPTDTPTATPRPTRTPLPTYTQYPTRTPRISPTP